MQKRTRWGLWAVATLAGAMSMAPMTAPVQSQTSMNGAMSMDKNAQMMINTLSEEKTEINTLAAQQAQFKKMGGRENLKIAALWGRMIGEHKAASPTLMALARKHGADPRQAKILKPPVLGSQEKMLMATHKDHEMSVKTSQMRHTQTDDPAIKTAMAKRADMSRRHIRWMMPYHDMMNKAGVQKMSMMCPHCNVKMVNGKCPHCGMAMKDMQKSST